MASGAQSVTSFFAKQPGAWEPPESQRVAVSAATPPGNAASQSNLQAFLGPPRAGSWVPPPPAQSKFQPPQQPISLPADVLQRLGSVRRPVLALQDFSPGQ